MTDLTANPLVSIIVRTKDRPKLLKRAVRSIAAQTYRPIEVVLVNDGGCDLDIEELKTILGDVSLNYQRLEKNTGRANAGNIGIENAQGKYIGFLDDDDEFYSEHVETLWAFLEQGDYEVAYTDSIYVFQEWITDKYVTVSKEVLYSQDFDRQRLLISNYIPLLNVLSRKDLIYKAGLFDEKLEAHEDWDLWLRLSQYSDFYHIKKITAEISMRTDGTTITSKNRMAFLETARIIHKRYSLFATDERIVKSQNMVQWSLAKEVVTRGEKLENSYLVDIAETLIQQKDTQIGNLEEGIRQKDTQIGNLEEGIRQKDTQIGNLEKAIEEGIREKDTQIGNLEEAIREKEATLNHIYSSRGWRALSFFYKVKGWQKRTVDAFMSRFARLSVSVYSSSTLIRRSFVAVNALSYKFVRPLSPALHDKFFLDFKLYLKQRWLVGSRGFDDAPQTQLYSLPKPVQEGFYPKVSVIIPNYNHARYLRQRLESVYGQTYQNIEVILLDDSSDDESTQILEEYRLRYPNLTRCCFNDRNSGSVFYQWKRGIELAQGELIWIAESDDCCSMNLLEELVRFFQNPAVKLAFARSIFVRGEPAVKVWTSEVYLSDLDLAIWDKSFIQAAHTLVKNGWAIKNLVPNVSGAVFRNPGKMALLDNPEWTRMRLCGDWMFYLSLIRGGLVAYSPSATNYYRQHPLNTSVNAQNENLYYQEFEVIARHLVQNYALERSCLEKQESHLYQHWCSRRGYLREDEFKALYDLDRVWQTSVDRKPNLMMAVYALTAGGGETFPIMLANLLHSRGYAVTLLNCCRQPTETGVRHMLSSSIPLLELNRLDLVDAVFADMGVEIVHSHHAWVDVTLASLLLNNHNVRQVITTHGMYEMMTPAQLEPLMLLLGRRTDCFVYSAKKNLSPFPQEFLDKKRFYRIDNALPHTAITPISRAELGVGDKDFVLCLVSRAIPEKGWEEAIAAVTWAHARSRRKIHLLLIGEGVEFKRLRSRVPQEFVHFLGFRPNIRDYFAAVDIGFLPSRFKGESFPLVLIDCLHAGKPFLASNVGEIRYMLDSDEGLAGELFDLEEWQIPVEAVGQIIHALANDPEAYHRLLHRVPLAAAKFHSGKMVDKYEEVYRSLVATENDTANITMKKMRGQR